MSTLAEQLQAFARERGGTLRYGKQPERPPLETPPSIGPSEKPTPRDPYIEYTDDYTVWKQGR